MPRFHQRRPCLTVPTALAAPRKRNDAQCANTQKGKHATHDATSRDYGCIAQPRQTGHFGTATTTMVSPTSQGVISSATICSVARAVMVQVLPEIVTVAA